MDKNARYINVCVYMYVCMYVCMCGCLCVYVDKCVCVNWGT